jgi:hypothetical protein
MLDDREFVLALMAPLRLLIACARKGRVEAAADCARHILFLIEMRKG